MNDANKIGDQVSDFVLNNKESIIYEIPEISNNNLTPDNILNNHINFRDNINEITGSPDVVDRVNVFRKNENNNIGKSISEIYDDLHKQKDIYDRQATNDRILDEFDGWNPGFLKHMPVLNN